MSTHRLSVVESQPKPTKKATSPLVAMERSHRRTITLALVCIEKVTARADMSLRGAKLECLRDLACRLETNQGMLAERIIAAAPEEDRARLKGELL